MQRKYFYNFITTLLIISFILTPYLGIVSRANAQAAIFGHSSGLVPAIARLPQCADVIGSEVRSLFGGIPDITEKPGDVLGEYDPTTDTYQAPILKKQLEEESKAKAKVYDSLNVNISDTEEGKAILKTYENSVATKKAVESTNTNSTCIQSIGRLMIKMLLQKLTVSTVAWINSGFDGSPAFIQDPGQFFGDIAKDEVLQFGLEINDPELFPFGKAWMKNTAAAFNNKFQDNARYTLEEKVKKNNPAFTAQTFAQDFSQGGWDAWTAMTQSPANNPLGFQIMASNELQRRLAGTTQSLAQDTRDALKEANGFLGDKRCVDPEGLTKEQDRKALIEGKKIVENGKTIIAGTCQEWQYVTPGSMIADYATQVTGYQSNVYLNVQDLNDAVAAVIDALLGQFSNNIMEKGFANLGTEGSDGSLVFSGVDFKAKKSKVEEDFSPIHLSSSWLSANPNFDIRKDLTQALIDEQRTYSDKLALQNKELMSTTDGKEYAMNNSTGVSNAYGLIPAVYQLDYCIPGPHPGWEEDSRKTLASVTNTIVPETVESTKDKDMQAVIGMAKSILPLAGAAVGAAVVGTSGVVLGITLGTAAGPVGMAIGAIVGTLIGGLISALGDRDDAVNVRAYYATIISGLTGYLADYENKNDDRALNIESKSGAVNVLNTMLDRYTEIINKVYFTDSEILPPVSAEAAVNFDQLSGYIQIKKANEEKIALLKTTVNTLGDIKDAVDNLNNQKESKKITEEVYESKLKDQINAFGRLSADMVNGDDIASADNLYKQIIDKKEYIYNTLLKGPYGCEAFLQNKNNIKKFPSAGSGVREADRDWKNFDVNSIKRMTYPFPLFYDYNIFKKGDSIPDPFKSGFVNKIPDAGSDMYQNGDLIYGPGFLSFVFWTGEAGGNDARRGAERLKIHDLVPQTGGDQQSKYRALGKRQREPGPEADRPDGGPFETTIGIY